MIKAPLMRYTKSFVKYPASNANWAQDVSMKTILYQLDPIDEMVDAFDNSLHLQSHRHDDISSWSKCLMKKAQPCMHTLCCQMNKNDKGAEFITGSSNDNHQLHVQYRNEDSWGYFVDIKDD